MPTRTEPVFLLPDSRLRKLEGGDFPNATWRLGRCSRTATGEHCRITARLGGSQWTGSVDKDALDQANQDIGVRVVLERSARN